MSSSFFALGLMFLIINSCQAQNLTANIDNKSGIKDSGPYIDLSCDLTDFQDDVDVEWLFQDKEIKDKETDKYSIQSKNPTDHYYSFLTIFSISKEDEGYYFCRIPSGQNSSIHVEVDSYLPGRDFPKCSTNPQNLTFYTATEIKFTCDSGDSKPLMNLKLNFGDHTSTSNETKFQATITEQATIANNGQSFTCKMTSNTFSGFERTCSIGPVNIITTTSLLPTDSSNTTGQGPIDSQLGLSREPVVGILVGNVVIIVIVVIVLGIVCYGSRKVYKIDNRVKALAGKNNPDNMPLV